MLDKIALAKARAETLNWQFKAIPVSAHGMTVDEWLKEKPALVDLPSPVLVLEETPLSANIARMAAWCDSVGLSHAPHGKTTMAPALWQRQIDAGAVGITVANASQLNVARAFGVPRVIVANELVSPDVVVWLADWASEGARVTCFVDSIASVSIMDSALRRTDVTIDVCVELGGMGGRAGSRDHDSARKVAAAVRSTRSLKLVGIGGYEGALAKDSSPKSLAVVDDYLRRLRNLHESLTYETVRPMITVGGSQYFDQVAEVLAPLASDDVEVVLRAGSYIAHDHGMYDAMSPVKRGGSGPELSPALTVYSRVLSKPETGLAVLDVGRRDVPFDAHLPVLLDVPDATIVSLNDQHAHVRGDVSTLAVGERVRLGISHPCTAFDRWNLIPVMDAQGNVIDVIRTYF